MCKFNKFWAMALTTVMSLSLTSPVFAVDTEARMITLASVEGDSVRATRGDPREFDARAGQRLGEGHTLATGRDSFAYIQMDQESLLKMDEQSQLIVSRASRDRLSLTVESGSALVHASNQTPGHTLETRIGNTALAVRGTLYVMGRDSVGVITITMLEGSGDVDGKYLPAGYVLRIYDDRYTMSPLRVEDMDNFTLQAVQDHGYMLLEIGVVTPEMLAEVSELLEQQLQGSLIEEYNARNVIVQWGQRNTTELLAASRRTASASSSSTRRATSRPGNGTATQPSLPGGGGGGGTNLPPGSGSGGGGINLPPGGVNPGPGPGNGGGTDPTPGPGDGGGTDPAPGPGGTDPAPGPGDGGGADPDPGPGGTDPDPGDGGGTDPDPDPGDGNGTDPDPNPGGGPVVIAELPGAGTANDPYRLGSAGDLTLLHNMGNEFRDTYFVLDSDIPFMQNVSIGHANNNDDIVPFNGTFNGDGFAVVNIAGLGTSTSVGMFAYIGEYGVVRNLNISGSINAHSIVGAVAGVNRGTIQNVISEINVTGTADFVGGLVGINYGVIEDSFVSPGMGSTTEIIGCTNVGGIAGQNRGTIRNTASLAVNMEISWSGAGVNFYRVAGGSSGVWQNNFAHAGMSVIGSTVSGTGDNPHGQNVTVAEFSTQSFWETELSFDFANTWAWDSTLNLPTLQSTVPYISGSEGLFAEIFPDIPMTSTPSALESVNCDLVDEYCGMQQLYVPDLDEPDQYLLN